MSATRPRSRVGSKPVVYATRGVLAAARRLAYPGVLEVDVAREIAAGQFAAAPPVAGRDDRSGAVVVRLRGGAWLARAITDLNPGASLVRRRELADHGSGHVRLLIAEPIDPVGRLASRCTFGDHLPSFCGRSPRRIPAFPEPKGGEMAVGVLGRRGRPNLY